LSYEVSFIIFGSLALVMSVITMIVYASKEFAKIEQNLLVRKDHHHHLLFHHDMGCHHHHIVHKSK